MKRKFTEQSPCIPTDLQCEFISESAKNANNLMTQVFLSSSEKDEEIKTKIRKSLIREGFTIWTNKTDIKTGTAFSEAINHTNLRQNLASILDEAIADRNVIIVTRQGKEDVAILAADELSNILETLHLFRSPANAQKLIAAMERADAITNEAESKSESLAELCQELDLER